MVCKIEKKIVIMIPRKARLTEKVSTQKKAVAISSKHGNSRYPKILDTFFNIEEDVFDAFLRSHTSWLFVNEYILSKICRRKMKWVGSIYIVVCGSGGVLCIRNQPILKMGFKVKLNKAVLRFFYIVFFFLAYKFCKYCSNIKFTKKLKKSHACSTCLQSLFPPRYFQKPNPMFRV